ncbi:hypothetical protein UFOVP97_42 [uncultured Caudovirales phage]|uniref:Uncharacterized protein n=1 Tax=uncultured Caudovirales phage TaxID=2100421 RepID=A0A6J5L398_9CAUD|nr:hypothetical protein UFOVP97_42 [uncultured Caudovirales phage]CAB4134005.1 hypothetical protein UFOVP268_4 [uncultured Caudovirales phage]
MPIFGALQNPTFNPALATIVSISQATNATVQTDFPHTFIVGQYIKFIIPISYGMIQLNNMTGLILSTGTGSSFFIIDIDTTGFDTFTVPANPQQSAQAIPTGELATQFYGANVNVLATPYPPYPNPSPLP